MRSKVEGIIVFCILAMLSVVTQAQTNTKVVVIPMMGGDGAAKWRGTWGEDVDYMKGDIVEEGGSSYIAKESHTSSLSDIPPDITYWDIVAASGANGLNGAKGDPGNDGAPGPKGDKGDTGDSGIAATVTIGTTTTGAAGTDASVSNSGTNSAAILDFVIPKGDKGDTGLVDQVTLDKLTRQLAATRKILSLFTKTVFVTSEYYDADLVAAANALGGSTYTDGLAAGDAICQFHANEASLPGTYKAWLSNDSESPSTRFNHGTVPYVLTTGDKIADDWDDLVDGTLLSQINVDEHGIPDPSFWITTFTGTNPDGTGTIYNCEGWSDNTAIPGSLDDTYTAGYYDQIDSGWTDSRLWPYCVDPAHLYCFQQ